MQPECNLFMNLSGEDAIMVKTWFAANFGSKTYIISDLQSTFRLFYAPSIGPPDPSFL